MALQEQETFSPPAAMKAAVRQGARWREEFDVRTPDKAVRFGQRILEGRAFTLKEVKDLRTWFRRNARWKDTPPDKGMGGTCWRLMGGDAGWAWTEKILDEHADLAEALAELPDDLDEDQSVVEALAVIFQWVARKMPLAAEDLMTRLHESQDPPVFPPCTDDGEPQGLDDFEESGMLWREAAYADPDLDGDA